MPKCTHCKKELDKTTAYLIESVTKGGNKSRKWYCSKEEYEQIQHDKIKKNEVYVEILKYFPSIEMANSLPKFLFMEVGIIASQHSWDKIYDYLQENTDYIKRALDKDFLGDASKGKYLAAMIRTGCEKEQRVVTREPVKKQVEIETDVIPERVIYKKKDKKRPSLADVIGEI